MDGPFAILLAALGIGFLIFIHELGHFICARLAGVRVEVFSLGFGTRLFGVVFRGTDYRVSLVPLGGYVRVAGEDPTQRRGLADDDLHAKSFGARALFFSGGVVMNLLFALIAFPIVFKHGVSFTAPVIGRVAPGSAAWKAGLQPGDRVLEVNGKEMYSFENLLVEVALAGPRGVELRFVRGDDTFAVALDPQYSERMGLYELGVARAVEAQPLIVESVDSASNAARAGLQPDDAIVAIGGEPAVGADAERALGEAIREPGTTLALEVERDGARRALAFVPDLEKDSKARMGVLQAQRRVVGIRPGLDAIDRLGLKTGDVIVAIDGERFPGDGLEPIADGGSRLSLQVWRDGGTLVLQAPVTPAERLALRDHVALGSDSSAVGPGVAVLPRPGTPAAAAGLLPGDEIVAVDGTAIRSYDDLVAAVERAGTSEMRVKWRRDAAEFEAGVRPARADVPTLGFVPRLDFVQNVYRVETVGAAIGAGVVASVDLIKQLYVTLKRLFTGDVAARNLGGIIQISRVSYHYAQSGWARFLYFLGLLSINLAFINVLPIPVLDGGHLLFLLIERIKGSPVSAQVLNYSQILGLVFVIALMVYVTYNDILKLL